MQSLEHVGDVFGDTIPQRKGPPGARSAVAAALFLLSGVFLTTAVVAQETEAEKQEKQIEDQVPDPSAGSLEIELNKLAQEENICRAYIVVNNTSDANYTVYKLDLVMFRPDGIIARRFAIDLAPILPNKRTVKLFDVEDLKCDEIGSFLINSVMECGAGGATPDNCLARIEASSRTEANFTK